MIRINKGREPEAWRLRRITPGFTAFESIPELRSSLLEEQGFICAYCMRRIPVRDPWSDADTKIEHIRPRSTHPAMELEYGNLAVCCPGFMDGVAHCDSSKGDGIVSFNIHESRLQDSISYSLHDGSIRSSVPDWNEDLDRVLNLNHEKLKANRNEALTAVITVLNRKAGGDGRWSPRTVQVQLDRWRSRDGEGRFFPFCGIVIWFLKKRLKAISSMR